MIKIKRNYEKFEMHFSEPGTYWPSFVIEADDLDQVDTATRHYLGKPHNFDICPVCKKIAREKKP